MKISCQSCQAKYTIADEKVRGKTVKIRCKKCGTTIVVSASETNADAGAPLEQDDAPTRVFSHEQHASSSDEWTVNVGDGDQRSLTTAQLIALHGGGEVNDETYAWREGMDDWLPLREIEALRPLLSPSARASAVPAAPSERASVPAPAPAPAPAPLPAAPAPPAVASSPRPAAARRPSPRGGSADLFGRSAGSDDEVTTSASATPQAVDEHDKATGARNENSVLFSLSALTATGAMSPATPSKPDMSESSGIVDIAKLASPGPAKLSPGKSNVDDIMNLGGGALFASTLAAPALAPPSTAELTSAVSLADERGAAGATAASGGNKKAIIGIVSAAVVAVVAVAIFAFSGKKEEGPAPAVSTTAVAAATTTPPAAPEAPATATATAEAPAAPAPTAANDTANGEPEKGPTEPAAVPAAARPTKVEKVVDKPAPAAKPTPPPAAPAAVAAPAAKPTPAPPPAAAPAADGAPFDRAAAMSALSSAASAAAGCKKPDGPTGSGRVSVTFAPSGNATTANVEGPPFAGTSVGGCVAAKFRSARVPPFGGGTVTVHKSFSIN